MAVYTRTELKIKYDMDFCLELEECEMITAHIGDLTIVFTYLANGRKATGLNCMIEQIEALYDLYDKVIVMGDFNTRMYITPRDRWNESGRRLSKYLKESSFSGAPINWATLLPASTCLDHCITTHMDAISDWGIIERSFDLDHIPIWIEVNVDINCIVKQMVTKTTCSNVVNEVEDNIEEWNV